MTTQMDINTLFAPHVDSFNFAMGEGLKQLVPLIQPVSLQEGSTIEVEDLHISKPSNNIDGSRKDVTPQECRAGQMSYSGTLTASLKLDNGLESKTMSLSLGEVPIMVKSSACHLYEMEDESKFERGEDFYDGGGYFILNGIERLVRLLIMPRRNYPMAVNRPSFAKRGKDFTTQGIITRCCTHDQRFITNTTHYQSSGNVLIRFSYKKNEYFIPAGLLLHALIDCSDRRIFDKIDPRHHGMLVSVLRNNGEQGWNSQDAARKYIGLHFAAIMENELHTKDPLTICRFIFANYIFVHCNKMVDKFNFLCLVLEKLFAFVSGDIVDDNQDSLMNQEALLPGHLYLTFLRERVEEWLQANRLAFGKKHHKRSTLLSLDELSALLKYNPVNVGRRVEHLIITGNLVSDSGLDLMQVSGYTIVAERLNFLRFVSHFQSIHRGQFFTEMKTTTVRKLLPECWGFLCPVHTPDGTPCGLLNHLAERCQLTSEYTDGSGVEDVIMQFDLSTKNSGATFPVTFNGIMKGFATHQEMINMAGLLRKLKTTGTPGVPKELEIALIPESKGLFCGLYLSTDPGRFIRPVQNEALKAVEFIGALEQPFLRIAAPGAEISNPSHRELRATDFLSFAASLTPYSANNQSPRNMYQCQMAKQTMGTPFLAFKHRFDNKAYRINGPQSPLVRNQDYDSFGLDNYAMGTNACVAVLSYTGFDMEDAMILSKMTAERGFGHGTVYKTKILRLKDHIDGDVGKDSRFRKDPKNGFDYLDDDGLPPAGTAMHSGMAIASYYDGTLQEYKMIKYKDSEQSIVDDACVLTTENPPLAVIRLRVNRNPIIGDKFSSRHGQKGVLSQKWPTEDLPFSESGITPDLLINPHAFPSRMTIGMLIESNAGKLSSLDGVFTDSTPFQKDSPLETIGEGLVRNGFNYWGSEPFYSGMTGTPFSGDIFFGCVYYQRLRHMVSDKFQVRATGPVNRVTMQPVKGRKVGGGIRFGEMERDSIISHGGAALLKDRLFDCSDGQTVHQCPTCHLTSRREMIVCKHCQTPMMVVNVPWVFKYLTAELAAMNIKAEITYEALR